MNQNSTSALPIFCPEKAGEPLNDALIRQARHGSQECLGRLLQIFVPQLTQLAERLMSAELRVRMAASDLVQETLISAGTGFAGFRGDTISEFREWLMRHFQSRLVDGMRRHRVSEKRRIGREVSRVEGRIAKQLADRNSSEDDQEDVTQLLTAISRLPADLRNVVLLHYRDQLSFEAIGAMLNLSAATVWRRWMEALQILKVDLANCGLY